jgi:putative nucleotidyltransferase with HDIG domain
VVATVFVIVLPAFAVSALVPAAGAAWLLVSVPLAIVLSVVAASAGAEFWMRRPGSKDLVFADLMLWGWLRRYRAVRRLAEAREVFGHDAKGLDADQRIEALSRLSSLLDARDAYTHRHSRRVTRHAERIAGRMHLSPAEVAKVRTAAALHDVGKIHTPSEILHKAGRLTEAEFAVIKRHPSDGADMLSGIEDREITAMVRHHHERVDGTGYPDGLSGEEIPLGARIIAVADTFDAITSRSYRGASSHKRALDILAKEAGTQLDRGAVSAFLGYYSGRRSVAWSALLTAAPHRLLAWLGSSSQGLAAGMPSLALTLPALGAAALLAVPNPTPSSLVDAHRSGKPGRSSSHISSAAPPGATPDAAQLVSERRRPRQRSRRESGARRRAHQPSPVSTVIPVSVPRDPKTPTSNQPDTVAHPDRYSLVLG